MTLLLQLPPDDYRCRDSLHGRHRFGHGTTCLECGRPFMDAHRAKVFCDYQKRIGLPKGSTQKQSFVEKLAADGCASEDKEGPEIDELKWLIARHEVRCGNCMKTVGKGKPFQRHVFCDGGRITFHTCAPCVFLEFPEDMR